MLKTSRENKIKLFTFGIFTVITVFFVLIFCSMTAGAKNKNKTKIIKKNNDFKVSAEYGLGGFVVYENPMQAVVTIESSKDFTGIIQVVGETDYGETVTAYGKRITIAAGEKKTYRFAAKPPTSTGVVRLIISNDREKPVYEEKTTVEMTSLGDRSLLGVLSDDYSGLGYLNGTSYAVLGNNDYRSVSTMEFNKDSFPEDAQVLSIMKFLIIDNFDTSTLSEKQFKALEQWVADGGILILSLGSHYQNVLSGFKDDFVSGTINDVSKRDLKWTGIEQEYSLGSVDCLDFQLNEGIEMSMYTADKTAWKKSYGLGEVVMLSYSLSMEPMSSWPDRKEVASMLLGEINEDSAAVPSSYLFSSMIEIASISGAVKKPSSILYGLLLSIYVVFVGPVLYLILKKKNKREKIWMAIPIVSLVFTGIIYCTSFIYRINKPLLNSITVVQTSDGGAKETVYSELICPSAKRYDLKLNDEYTGFRNEFNQYDYSFLGNNNKSKDGLYDTMYLENGSGNELILNSDSAFDKFDFAMSRSLNEGVGEISLDLECDWNYMKGSITNNTAYDLRGVVVTYEGMIYPAGDMKKGETVEIDENKVLNTTGYGTFESLWTGNGSSEEYKTYRINSAMEQVIAINNYNHGYVWGTIASYPSELISDKQAKMSGTGVIFDTYYKEKKGGSSSITPVIADIQGDCDDRSGEIYSDSVTITYSFEGHKDINNIIPITETNNSAGNVYNITSCEALNVDTGEYEPVFVDGQELSGADLDKYLSHGILTLRYSKKDNSQGGSYVQYVMPRIVAFCK